MIAHVGVPFVRVRRSAEPAESFTFPGAIVKLTVSEVFAR
jgi:hypothetical protein